VATLCTVVSKLHPSSVCVMRPPVATEGVAVGGVVALVEGVIVRPLCFRSMSGNEPSCQTRLIRFRLDWIPQSRSSMPFAISAWMKSRPLGLMTSDAWFGGTKGPPVAIEFASVRAVASMRVWQPCM
jgi:hypothetical protein